MRISFSSLVVSYKCIKNKKYLFLIILGHHGYLHDEPLIIATEKGKITAFVYVGAKHAGKNQPSRDTMSYLASQDFKEAKMWTRKIRVYKDISLQAFVDEMSRWEGFTIKKWDCIPKDRHISVSICYQSGREEVYSAIRQAGILLHEEKGMVSFCPEDKRDRMAMKLSDSGIGGSR